MEGFAASCLGFFELVEFFHFVEVGDDERDVRADPCGRAREADAQKPEKTRHHESDQHTHDQLDGAAHQRVDAFADALQSAAEDEERVEGNEEAGEDIEVNAAGIQRFSQSCRISRDEELENRHAEQSAEERGNDRPDQCDYTPAPHALTDAAVLPGADILAGEGGHGGGEGKARHGNKAFHLAGGGVAGDMAGFAASAYMRIIGSVLDLRR